MQRLEKHANTEVAPVRLQQPGPEPRPQALPPVRWVPVVPLQGPRGVGQGPPDGRYSELRRGFSPSLQRVRGFSLPAPSDSADLHATYSTASETAQAEDDTQLQTDTQDHRHRSQQRRKHMYTQDHRHRSQQRRKHERANLWTAPAHPGSAVPQRTTTPQRQPGRGSGRGTERERAARLEPGAY